MTGGIPGARRLSLLAVALFGAALLWPASSEAFVSCSFSNRQVNVDLTSDDDAVTFQRFGARVAVVAGYDEILIPCDGGTPTVDNTDTVVLHQLAAGGESEIELDLSSGPFSPGATPETDGTSEIEFNLQMPPRSDSDLFLVGTEAPDSFTLGVTPSGAAGINLSSEPAASADADVELSGFRFALIGTLGGADSVTGQGGPGFAGPLGSRPQFGVYGGAGRDQLVASPAGSGLLGQAGPDFLLGSNGPDFLNGGGRVDRLVAGKGRDQIFSVDGKRDRIKCGPASDRAAVDQRDKPKGCEKVSRRRAEHRRGRHLEQPSVVG